MGDENVILRINGVEWLSWKNVELSRQVDAVCGQFTLNLGDRWRHDAQALPLAAGMPCEVLAGNDGLINGYIDKVNHSFSPGNHAITVSGRDKTGDLVDCSAIHSPGQFNNLTLPELAQILAAPYGISVINETENGPAISSFKIEDGETSFAALDRALKMREVLAVPDGLGNLKLIRPGAASCGSALKQGENLKEGGADYDMADRFSDYIVKGQKPGTDEEYGLKAAQVRGEARDESVERYRPLLVRAENQGNQADAVKRAKWEASVRAARAVTVTAATSGWRENGGQLWDVGKLVMFDAPYLRLKQNLLIAKLTFSIGPGGTVTRFELKDPKAFDPEPPKKNINGHFGGGDLQQAAASSAGSAHEEINGGKWNNGN